MYIQLLMMYPIIMFFIAASSVVGGVFMGGGLLMSIMGLIVQILPFIILPFTFKFAGGMMSNISGRLQGLAQKGGKAAWNNSGVKADLDKFKGMRKQSQDAKSDERVAKRLKNMQSGRGVTGTLGRKALLRGMDQGSVDRYAGGFEDKVDKRKSDEASAALATKLRGTTDRKQTIKLLDNEYRDAMARGDTHTANAAYKGLVGQQAESQLRAIQSEANTGQIRDSSGSLHSIDSGTYNQQQGANYGELKSFAPHLTGDVGGLTPTQLSAQRAQNLADMNNEALSGVKAEAWEEWARIDPAAAATRYVNIAAEGGGAAARLAPTARAALAADPSVAAKVNMTDSAIEAAHPLVLANRDELVQAAKEERDKWKNALT